MRRDPARLVDKTFDLLVVGAGIHGACVAWDACLRGLTVAVIDQGDFGSGTSANSLGIVHGGLRYLARGDLRRMFQSIEERSTLLRIAPGLVEPLPVLVATYGRGLRSRMAHAAALALSDLVSRDRNRGLDPGRLIPSGRLVSREECIDHFPWFRQIDGLTGGALWYDAQLRHPERLTLRFLHSAAERGAVPANYVRVDGLQIRNGAVEGAGVTDCVTGSQLEIRARAVLVAAGHWTDGLIARASGAVAPMSRQHALGVNVVLAPRLAAVAVGVQARSGRDRDPVCGGRRFLFLAPHGSATILGTSYTMGDVADPEAAAERGARTLVQELSEACPGLDLSLDDVVRYQWGWLPLKSGLEPGRAYSLAERPRLVDHGRDGLRHLFSVEGVKYTTARRVAERAVDRVFRDLGRPSPPCRTSTMPLHAHRAVAGAEIQYAVREEMAIKLADIVFRRTDLGTVPGPDRTTVREAARVAGAELGWDAERHRAEIEDVMRKAGVPRPALEAVG